MLIHHITRLQNFHDNVIRAPLFLPLTTFKSTQPNVEKTNRLFSYILNTYNLRLEILTEITQFQFLIMMIVVAKNTTDEYITIL